MQFTLSLITLLATITAVSASTASTRASTRTSGMVGGMDIVDPPSEHTVKLPVGSACVIAGQSAECESDRCLISAGESDFTCQPYCAKKEVVLPWGACGCVKKWGSIDGVCGATGSTCPAPRRPDPYCAGGYCLDAGKGPNEKGVCS